MRLYVTTTVYCLSCYTMKLYVTSRFLITNNICASMWHYFEHIHFLHFLCSPFFCVESLKTPFAAILYSSSNNWTQGVHS